MKSDHSGLVLEFSDSPIEYVSGDNEPLVVDVLLAELPRLVVVAHRLDAAEHEYPTVLVALLLRILHYPQICLFVDFLGKPEQRIRDSLVFHAIVYLDDTVVDHDEEPVIVVPVYGYDEFGLLDD